MATMKELGFPKIGTGNLKQQLIRTTLRNIRSQGHTYVELREDGKKLIFFCTLCLAPCYSDSVLFDHLKGNLHSGRLATAQVTLMKSNPWPFSDGVLFFHGNANGREKPLLLDYEEIDTARIDGKSLAIVRYDDQSCVSRGGKNCAVQEEDPNQESDDSCDEVVIPGVLLKEEVSDLVVRHIGVGRIGARLFEKDGVSGQFHRIWCEWLSCDEGNEVIVEHEFALVIFTYDYALGRMAALEDFRYLLPSSGSDSGVRKRKSFSDPEEDTSDLSNQDGSSGEDSLSSNTVSSNDQQALSRIVSSKAARKQMRNNLRVVSERLCDICQQQMLPNKDVAALMNTQTGRLVCSSRNHTGAFHLFHVSCLIHWLLLCEVERYGKHPVEPKTKRRARKNAKAKKSKMQQMPSSTSFCPECQGTGVVIDGEELEKPTVSLSEIFKYKIKLCDAHKAWMKNPEDLHNCSMGFSFPIPSGEITEESVAYLKLLHFYRAVV